MRKMYNKDMKITLEIEEWIMTINGWEYYLTPKEKNQPDNIRFAMVNGVADEMGSVDLDEIKPYIWSRTKDLSSLQPACGGWEWL